MTVPLAIASDNIRRWREHPAQMVRELFKVEPDAWQEEALEKFPHKLRIAMKSCRGPGKTATLAWIGWNFLLTRPHPIIGATSSSGDNLKANLWTELARWREQTPILKAAFEMTKTEIFARDHPKTWKMEARTWAKDADQVQIGSALAGLHAQYVMWLLDESGDHPDAILPAVEAIFAGDPKEAHIVQAGNPRRRSGPLYIACVTARNLWYVVEITADPDDPRRSPRISIEHARNQIATYGRDNPWILVDIFGQFPPADFNALIGIEEVNEARKRYYREHELKGSPRVMAVDVARQGDDASVLCKRWGLQMMPLKKWRNITGIQGAGEIQREWTQWKADACFVDATGGFGSSWIDNLMLLRRAPIGVQYAAAAHDPQRFYNKRSEMAWDFVEWIKRGGAIADDDNLGAALVSTNYTFKGDRFILEPKEDVKDKLGYSPDEFDAAMMTFAEPIQPISQTMFNRPRAPTTYDPFAEFNQMGIGSAVSQSYDPFK